MIVKNWTEAPVKPGMSVLHVGKRVSPYQHWEPIYIGTNNVSFINTIIGNQYTLRQIM